ncbi:ImmA/IrrE family metallo-endopeptidase [Bacillus thuringiensis]|uniref:ImmA/IrrE family metallo-endopeptidase n=1 Tax=Bacillus thuringiensis serovar andalousiensis TaxID=257985 RepID=A0A6H0TS68_BACTU|nr:ImmA/IrrE family metallo-endopeptidase [Bacillus thuringiensis]QIW22136.1 ImmA/IrrE family metallo-endopeptidase [Bacillus thuringiensis serovar andalousiensis]
MSKNYKKKYQTKSPEEKKEAVQALTKKMEKSVEGYFRTPGDLKEYLTFMAKFYHYSPSNISLIQSQFQGASAVGSFSFWKEKGFPVKKGEKGIKILVPNRTVAKFKDKDGTWKSVTKASEQEKKQIESKSVEVKPGRLYFALGHVFDVSQTNAKAEDLPRIFPNRWLEGSVTDYKSLYRGMEAIAEKNGVKIIEPKQELGVAKGVSYTLTREVALNPRNSELQNVKTLLHELAHAKLHTAETHMDYTAPEKEFQAEMTAYAVSSYFGIDTSEYSLGYLASWTQGKEMKDKTKLLKEVHETSIEFIETIENTLEKAKEKTNEKGVDHMSKQVSEHEKDNFEILTSIQQNAQRNINEKLGLNFERQWKNYEIQLSEDGRIIEGIYPNMRLTVGEMHAIVNQYGTETEKQSINKITKTLEFFHEMDEYEYPELVNKEVLKTPIAKVTSNSKGDMNVECLSGRIEDKRGLFKFDNAISQTVNQINHSISESHNDIVSLMEKNGERENVYLDNILKSDLYEKVQDSIFDGKGNQSFVIHEKDANMSLDEIVKDERYGILVDKAEEQKDPSFSEKEVELYKEMKTDGYAPIASLDQQIQPLKEKEPTILDKDLSQKFEAYRRSQYEETPDNIDSIVTRVKAEERYYTTKYVSIDNELVSQEHVVKLENQVDEKLGKEGISVNQSTTSKEMDFDKNFQPLNGKQTNDKEKDKEIDPGNVEQSKSTKKSGRKKETMEMER